MSRREPVLLTIAGSDSGGGAGIQADLRAFWDHGWHGATVITAVTAQDTARVWRIDPVPPDGIREQLRAVLTDLTVAAIKIGMLGDAATILTVADGLREHAPNVPIVLDPVMVATSGDPLLDPHAVGALTERLIPLATVITPNLHEARLLVPHEVDPDVLSATVSGRYGVACLATGGDAAGREVVDVLTDPGVGAHTWRLPRLPAGSHGTGCTLSSAIAARLGRGEALVDACEGAIHYVRSRLTHPLTVGAGSTVLGRARP